MIYSRPRHPQSQGKVERYHKTLRSRMEYDLQEIRQDRVNWAKQLPLYQRTKEQPQGSYSLKNTIRNIFCTQVQRFQRE